MLLPRTAILGVALAAALALPLASALGDDPPTADLGMTMTLTDQYALGPAPVIDPSSPLMIGSYLSFDYHITNHGPDAAPFDLQIPRSDPQVPFALEVWSAYNSGDTCRDIGTALDCTGTLNAGKTEMIEATGYGDAPGQATVTATLSSTVADPDLSNNTATWSNDVDCQVNGTDGNDTLVAHAGQAACGFGGNDTLIAEPNSLGLFGGAGNDTLDASRGDPPAGPAIMSSGGPGFDTVTLANAPNPMWACPGDTVAGPGFAIGPRDTPDIGGGDFTEIERIVGSRYNDLLIGNQEPNAIDGGGGNDLIFGGAGRDTLDGGPGNDRFVGRDSTPDQINGGTGADRAEVDRGDRTTSVLDQRSTLASNPCS